MALEQRMKTETERTGFNLARLRKRVAFELFLRRLAQLVPDRWVLKGALALNFRLGGSSRSTKDIDLGRDDDEEAAIEDIAAAPRSTVAPTDGRQRSEGSRKPPIRDQPGRMSPSTWAEVTVSDMQGVRHFWREVPERENGPSPSLVLVDRLRVTRRAGVGRVPGPGVVEVSEGVNGDRGLRHLRRLGPCLES
jgi:hypothetical protein